MKIAILTQPLYTNYGGILQAYAVQKILKDRGHVVLTLDIRTKEKPLRKGSVYKELRTWCATILYWIFGKNRWSEIYWPFNHYTRNYGAIGTVMQPFIERIINRSPLLTDEKDLKSYVEQKGFEAYVVGSDQVWRPIYSPHVEWFFLDFLPDIPKVKRISLSASMGTDIWEFSEEQTRYIRHFVHKFDAISVREDSAVKLCRDYLGVEATLLIDPTMMLSPKDYDTLVDMDKENTFAVNSHVFTYILDESQDKMQLTLDLAKMVGKPVLALNNKGYFGPYSSIKNALKNGPKPVAQWIRAFEECDFVITDSFHGTVFSILYHCPFVVVENQNRGTSRLKNLLNIFGLSDRLITSLEKANHGWLLDGINWQKVDSILERKRSDFDKFINDYI